MDKENKNLNIRQKATIRVLFFVVRILAPMKYSHETDNFIKDIEQELELR